MLSKKIVAFTAAVVTVFSAAALPAADYIKFNNTSLTITADAAESLAVSGKIIKNINHNNYTNNFSVSESYIYQNSKGELVRVINSSGVTYAETYNSAGTKLLSTKSIKNELPLFGGFYSGKDYNFLVFGAENLSEKKDAEVIRIVKYKKDWTKVGTCHVKDSNTYKPFYKGNLSIVEVGSKLFISTCHQRCKNSKGNREQSNMHITVNESDMSVSDKMTGAHDIKMGYVSNSFNQFVKTDGSYIYRCDHGNGDTNGINITKHSKSKKSTDVTYQIPVKWESKAGATYTGASIGGFEVGKGKCIVAYNKDISISKCKNRNVYLCITNTSLKDKANVIKLTKFTEKDNTTCNTPQLVKVSENLYVVMWRVVPEKKDPYYQIVTVNASGNIKKSKTTTFSKLSDCQPVVAKDGEVKWFTCDGKSTMLYSLKTSNLDFQHTHKYTEKIDKKATCTASGSKTLTCKCGYTKTEKIPATGHSYSKDWSTDTAPTCTKEGSKSHHCTKCSAKSSVTAIPATGHKFSAEVTVKEATCTEDGIVKSKCTICGEEQTRKVDAKGHDQSGEWVVEEPATCTTEGLKVLYCADCHEKLKEETISTTHEYPQWTVVKAATCETAGYRERKCEKCGNEESEVIPATGHIYSSEWTTEQKADCTHKGIKYHKCQNCSEKTDITVIPATGHKFVKVRVVKPTLASQGYTVYKCNSCGEIVKKNFVPKLVSISSAQISGIKSTATYTGKSIRPKITVKAGGAVLKKGSDYVVKYGTNKLGKATVVISGKGRYTGKITRTFKIIPRRTTVSLKSAKKKFVVKIAKKSEAGKYQIKFASNKNFNGAKVVTIKGTRKTIRAKSHRNYYVKVRCISGKYVGGWSAVRKVTVK